MAGLPVAEHCLDSLTAAYPMTPTDLLQWVITNEATVGPVTDDRGLCIAWYCSTPDMRNAVGVSWEDSVEKCRDRKSVV